MSEGRGGGGGVPPSLWTPVWNKTVTSCISNTKGPQDPQALEVPVSPPPRTSPYSFRAPLPEPSLTPPQVSGGSGASRESRPPTPGSWTGLTDQFLYLSPHLAPCPRAQGSGHQGCSLSITQ